MGRRYLGYNKESKKIKQSNKKGKTVHDYHPVAGLIKSSRVVSLNADLKLDKNSIFQKQTKVVCNNKIISDKCVDGNRIIELSDHMRLKKHQVKAELLNSKKGNSKHVDVTNNFSVFVSNSNDVKLETVNSANRIHSVPLAMPKPVNSTIDIKSTKVFTANNKTYILVPKTGFNNEEKTEKDKVPIKPYYTQLVKTAELTSHIPGCTKQISFKPIKPKLNANAILRVLKQHQINDVVKTCTPSIPKQNARQHKIIIPTNSEVKPTDKTIVVQQNPMIQPKFVIQQNPVLQPNLVFQQKPVVQQNFVIPQEAVIQKESTFQNLVTKPKFVLKKLIPIVQTPQLKPQTNLVQNHTLQRISVSKNSPVQLTPVLQNPIILNRNPIVIKAKSTETNVIANMSNAVTQDSIVLNFNYTKEVKNDDKIQHKEDNGSNISFAGMGTNSVFPVALKLSDSNDFEYVELLDNKQINEDEMQILGI